MPAPRIDILMYHSISGHPGPTNIAPAIFKRQIKALADSGLPVLRLQDMIDRRSAGTLPARSVVITFDDGFQDFAETAWPILAAHNLGAINYLPTQFLGGWSEFDAAGGKRAIMTMQTAQDLMRDGADFGCHTVSHPNLTKLDATQLAHELDHSKMVLEQGLGQEISHIAPPFGAVNTRVNDQIARRFKSSVTTRLRPATGTDPLHALPRIEMFYFAQDHHWQAFLSGRLSYLNRRRMLRRIGQMRYFLRK